ncbi:MAG: DMT family transporter [Pseudomonadota bacterium]
MASNPPAYQTQSAVLAIILSVAALSLGDAVIKGSGLTLPLWQMLILRSALVVPVLLGLALHRRARILTNLRWTALRSLLLVCMWLSYYAALPLMPLSLAAAAFYTGPLFIVALSALVARHWPVGPVIVAIVAGFFGVLLIIRPDTSGFALGTLLPVLAAMLYACAMVLTSAKCRADDPIALVLFLNLSFILCGGVLGLFSGREGSFLLGPWQALTPPLMGAVSVLAILILIGSLGAAIAYQKGPPATVAAFDYSYLIFSLAWGAVFFAEWPSALGLIGIGIILGAGLLALPRRQG